MRNKRNSVNGGVASGIMLVGVALAFAFGGFNLTVFFIALAFASLVGSANRRNRQGMYGGIQGFIWLLALAFFFATYEWTWFLLALGVSSILGAMNQPVKRWLGTTNSFNASQQTPPQQYYQPPQHYYQPPQQTYQPPPSPSYEEGYRPATPAPEAYKEGEYQYPSPSSQYEQPMAEYPQEMPPPQQ